MEFIELILAGVFGASTMVLGFLTYRRNNQVKKLEEETEYLKKEIHRSTSKVDPESDRRLIEGAESSVQILGINSLAPLHHCREEIIEFLKDRNGAVQILLLDPRSSVFKEREKQEQDGSHRLFTEWKASLTILKDIQHQSGSDNGIEIRLRSDPPDRSLLIVDASGEPGNHSKMLINYYPKEHGARGYEGGQFLSEFVLERDRDSFFKNKRDFEERWGRARRAEVEELCSTYVVPTPNEPSASPR